VGIVRRQLGLVLPAQLAARFGLHPGTVRQIILRKTWKNVI